MYDSRQIQAFANLAIHFAWHSVRRLLPQGKGDGLAEFLDKYADDGVFAITEGERQAFRTFERCLSCGICQSACPVLAGPLGDRFLGPESLAVSGTRPLPDLVAGAEQFHACTACGACERVCPYGVPVAEMALFGRSAVAHRLPNLLPVAVRAAAESLAVEGCAPGQTQPASGSSTMAEVVLYRGCRGSADPAMTQAHLDALQAAGITATTVAEACCGAEPLACGLTPRTDWGARLAASVAGSGATSLVVSDATCWRSVRREPALAHLDVRFIWELLPEGRLPEGDFLLTPCALQGSRLEACGQARVPGDCGPVCCGAETGLQALHADASKAMAQVVLAQAQAAGATAIVTESPRCRQHLLAVQGAGPLLPVHSLSARQIVTPDPSRR